jgi:hypothetical protein
MRKHFLKAPDSVSDLSEYTGLISARIESVDKEFGFREDNDILCGRVIDTTCSKAISHKNMQDWDWQCTCGSVVHPLTSNPKGSFLQQEGLLNLEVTLSNGYVQKTVNGKTVMVGKTLTLNAIQVNGCSANGCPEEAEIFSCGFEDSVLSPYCKDHMRVISRYEKKQRRWVSFKELTENFALSNFSDKPLAVKTVNPLKGTPADKVLQAQKISKHVNFTAPPPSSHPFSFGTR